MNKQLFWLDPANKTSSFCEFINKKGDVVNIKQLGSQIEVAKFELFELVEDEETKQPLYLQNVIDDDYAISIVSFDIVEVNNNEECLSEIFTTFVKDGKPYVTLFNYQTCNTREVLWEELKTNTFIMNY